MDRGKKKSFGSREAQKQRHPLGLVVALAVAGGAVIGSAGTYVLTRPGNAPDQAASSTASPPAGGTPPAQTLTMPTIPQPQYTPAPQPPGPVPPGKVWSVEHGHWHDAPGARVFPAPAPSLE